MHQSLYPINQILTLNNKLVANLFTDLNEEQALIQITPENNNANWLLGHLSVSRQFMISVTGNSGNLDILGDTYRRAAVITADSSYQSLLLLEEIWEQSSAALAQALAEVSDTVLAGTPPKDFPVADKTILGGLTFLTAHESMHIGQLGFLRPALGLKSFFG